MRTEDQVTDGRFRVDGLGLLREEVGQAKMSDIPSYAVVQGGFVSESLASTSIITQSAQCVGTQKIRASSPGGHLA